jgi:ABC-type uncharacterized transport system YnjBCD ATPase subunit
VVEPYLCLRGLSKTYPGAGVPAVAGVDLDVRQGEMVALLGPSGCGKTTTLRMVAGLIEPTAGEIRLDGREIGTAPVHKRGMGMVFQSYALFPHLTVARNVAFGLETRGVAKAERQRRVAEALTLVRLGQFAERRIGQQQTRQRSALSLAIGLSAWFPVWAVLGVSRLHHLLATGTMTSKCGAGRYAQNEFDPRWQRIIAESLSLRTEGAEGHRGYSNPLARRRDTLAFLDTTIDAALALSAKS